jgi:hypothetical protein
VSQPGKQTSFIYFVASFQKSPLLNVLPFAPPGLNKSYALVKLVKSFIFEVMTLDKSLALARSPPLSCAASHRSHGIKQQSHKYSSWSAVVASRGSEEIPLTPSTRTVLAAVEQMSCFMIGSTVEVTFIV